MRSVNYRLLTSLVVLAALVSGGAWILHGYQLQRNANVLLREARAARERDDLVAAADWLERYLGFVQPDSPEYLSSLTELGTIQAELRRFDPALRNLESVLRIDKARADIRHKVIDLMLDSGRASEARHHLDVLLEADPDNHALVARRASCLFQLGEFPESAASITQAIRLAPQELEYHAKLAHLQCEQMQSPLRGLEVLDAMVEANAESPLAYVIRGEYRLDDRKAIARKLLNAPP